MFNEKNVKIAARFYECRDSAKSYAKLTGKQYDDMLKPYINIVNNVMKSNSLGALEALLKIATTRTYKESDMAQLMFMAAVVEIIEPSKS